MDGLWRSQRVGIAITLMQCIGVAALIGITGCEALFNGGSASPDRRGYSEVMRAESLAVLASNDTTYQRRM